MSGRVRDKAPRLDWPTILERAAEIVNSYDTGVTLRQLFYRLVAAQVLPNAQTVYRRLSARTAEARRAGTFPALVDATRGIVRPRSFDGPEQAREWLASIYRRDRTEGQEQTIYLGVEKQGLVALLQSWYWDMGLPIVALKGYGSQTYLDEIGEDVERQGRPAVMLYAGDFDPNRGGHRARPGQAVPGPGRAAHRADGGPGAGARAAREPGESGRQPRRGL